ncbi:MAG TPA: deaminase [Sedimentisphaerales bacterium]|nr:deaminase [Sedimentisphaerales bacterium]HRS11402.1 deaminase [Sedimentisphaerales bacterium]HRV48060.1 deaminase [Sedimentisphaerales bacterium]
MDRTSGKLIVGLTGSLGSGCTTLSKALEDRGFKRVSISSLIKDKFRALHQGKEPSRASYGPDWRAELQDIGNRGRQGEFAQERNSGEDFRPYWVRLALSKVKPEEEDVVIDGIRNAGEVEWLRNRYRSFWLVAVFADQKVRWSRLRETYDHDEKAFLRDDRRDSGEEERSGQTVQRCVYEADYVLKNVTPIEPPSKVKADLFTRLEEPLKGMRKEKGFRGPLAAEVFMATAVSQSHASQCLKRKVGALIVDDENKIPLSVGYNENPVGMESGFSLYRQVCHKDRVMASRLEKMTPFFCPECGTKHDEIRPPYVCNGKMAEGQLCRCNLKQKFFPSRGIELCTAIHAEERAILSLGGRSADGCTIYVNTFPCFQCARQIVNAPIKKVVYVEAYPIEEAVELLKANNVVIEPFEGFKPRVFNQVFRQVE